MVRAVGRFLLLALPCVSCVSVDYRGLTLPPVDHVRLLRNPREVPSGYVVIGRAVARVAEGAGVRQVERALLAKAREVGAEVIVLDSATSTTVEIIDQERDDPAQRADPISRRGGGSWANPMTWAVVRKSQRVPGRVLAEFLSRRSDVTRCTLLQPFLRPTGKAVVEKATSDSGPLL